METPNETPTAPNTVTLEKAVTRDPSITAVSIRKPGSGELRGLSLVDIGQLDVVALRKLLPRITSPRLLETDIDDLDPADLTEMGSIVGRFLLKKHHLTDFQGQSTT